MKKLFKCIKDCFSRIFKKKEKEEVKEVEPVINNKEYDLSVKNISEILDKYHESDDDVFTTIGILVCEVDDVYKANSKEDREAQKKDCINTLKYIESQIDAL